MILLDWVPRSWQYPWVTIPLFVCFAIWGLVEYFWSKAEIRNGRHVMRSILLFRLIGLVVLAFFGFIFAEQLSHYSSGQPVLGLAMNGVVVLVLISFSVDCFVRRMVYDDLGIEVIAFLALRRRIWIPWKQIVHITFDLDKIIVITPSSRHVIHGVFKGKNRFKERLRKECPEAEINDKY